MLRRFVLGSNRVVLLSRYRLFCYNTLITFSQLPLPRVSDSLTVSLLSFAFLVATATLRLKFWCMLCVIYLQFGLLFDYWQSYFGTYFSLFV